MIKNLFDNENAIFMGAKRNPDDCSIGIFGVNYDGTCSFKPGARFGPEAIRQVSSCLETYCPNLNKDLEDILYVDFGSILIDKNDSKSVIESVKSATNFLINKRLSPIMLGGEHSITTGAIEALVEKYPDLILVQLDAHADLRESYIGNKHSHACTMKRCLEVLPEKKILQVGIRSGTKEEFQIMHNNNQLVNFCPGGNAQNLRQALLPYSKCPIYLTIDLDWFDPSLLSGTGTPEPGGFFWNDFEEILKTLRDFRIVASDIVELSPEIDTSGVSSIVAAKILRSLILSLENMQ
ncbi:agmatinase [Prochlorococcus marinus XMU1406]|uniref:agmatinase n=1 Tax=Prochlorococcus marinus TaxID=1219 RepID=UPI001ADAC7ED|nr:agmatinase [Prochlorococcus marinus]MBO8207278.1 agmatinase [Prochlorococcus marinus XMU1406]MCR8543093.1 agmatinase [Prochlorococcus marinus XMU1427]